MFSIVIDFKMKDIFHPVLNNNSISKFVKQRMKVSCIQFWRHYIPTNLIEGHSIDQTHTKDTEIN